MKTLSYSAKLFRQFKSLSIRIEEMDDEYSFRYNGAHYCIHVDDAVGTFFIYRKMVLHLIYNVHDNVLHQCFQIPREHFFLALSHHKSKGINGFWGNKCSFVYTDLVYLDGELPLETVISELLVELESVYDRMREDLTYYMME